MRLAQHLQHGGRRPSRPEMARGSPSRFSKSVKSWAKVQQAPVDFPHRPAVGVSPPAPGASLSPRRGRKSPAGRPPPRPGAAPKRGCAPGGGCGASTSPGCGFGKRGSSPSPRVSSKGSAASRSGLWAELVPATRPVTRHSSPQRCLAAAGKAHRPAASPADVHRPGVGAPPPAAAGNRPRQPGPGAGNSSAPGPRPAGARLQPGVLSPTSTGWHGCWPAGTSAPSSGWRTAFPAMSLTLPGRTAPR